jgi:alpha-D-xyloside xylohydrolase
MFGNAFMVCPVTEPMYYGPDSTPLNNTNKTRQVYLPKDSVWYDFWTNKKYEGGQTITVNAEIEKLPLMVRAGSIIPMADISQHTNAITQDHFTLKVYSGYDGEFTLYQDERDNYNYEEGSYSIINLHWDDASGEMNIGDRIGTYDGMPDQVSFNIRIIRR